MTTDRFKKQTTLLLMLLTALGMNAQQQRGSKLSVWLQGAVTTQQDSQLRRDGSRQGEPLTTVFVQLGETVSDETLAQYGCKKYAQLGDIAIVTLPVTQVGALAELDAVQRIEANRTAQATMDSVSKSVNLLPVYEATDKHPAFTGNGVVVGVMDIGFDLTHPTFYDNTLLSQYRIKAFWDQLAPKGDVDRLPVGSDFTTPEAILAQGHAVDGRTQTHGTHTAGIAAGSGYGSPYRGAAFESDICLVANAVTADTAFIDRSDYYLYTSATDALGFKYLFDYAESQGKPCVVSFSEGYSPYMDSDDLLFSLFLERLTGPGRILVASAGNESRELTYVDKPQGRESAGAFIRCYQKQASYRIQTDGAMTLSLKAYGDDGLLTLSSADCLPDKPLTDTLFVGQDTCAVSLSCYASAFATDKTVYLLTLTGNEAFSKLPHIALTTTGIDSHVELFGSSSSAFANHDTDPQWNDAVKGHNIFAPGCFETVVTVGSTSHRLEFTNVAGTTVKNSNDHEPGTWSYFSSMGPTLDGRTKPDVLAPGCYVISSLSSYYLEEHPNSTGWHVAHFDCQGRKYVWGADSGTSMSAPVVAGAIALWLQANPYLTRDDIIGIFRRTCRQPEPTLTYPNNQYGYGEIDAYRGLLDILGLTNIDAISLHQPQQVCVFAQDGKLHLRFDTVPTTPIYINIYSTNGTLQYQTCLTATQKEEAIGLPPLANGIYAVQLTGDSHTTGSQLVRL